MSHSSSEDDFSTNINLPNLKHYKKHKNRSRTNLNLVKAGKKIVSSKSKNQRPGPEGAARQSYMSATSSVTNQSSQTQQSSDDSDPGFEENTNLPTFGASSGPQEGGEGNGDSDDDNDNYLQSSYSEGDHPDQLGESDSDEDNDKQKDESPNDDKQKDVLNKHEHQKEPVQSYELDDLTHGDEPRDLHDLRSQESKPSRTSSRHHFFRRPSIPASFSRRAETDITDQLESATSRSSKDTSRSSNRFKDILRKVALTDQQYPETPHSDTFIGRVLENEPGLGLSGGGLAPGASRQSKERTIDEEEEMGLSDDEIAMQKLDFAQLSNEARNLINVHLPESMQQPAVDPYQPEPYQPEPYQQEQKTDMMERVQMNASGSSSESMTKEKDNNEGTNNDEAAHNDQSAHNDDNKSRKTTESERRKKDPDLYAPNPDLFLRGDVAYNDENEFMMLDDNSEINIAPPTKVQAGVLSSLLKLYQHQEEEKSASSLAYDDATTLQGIDTGSRTSTNMSFSQLKDEIKQGGKKMYDHIPFAKRTGSSQNVIDENQEFGGDGNYPAADTSGMPSFQNAKPKVHKKATVNPAAVPSKFGKKIKKAKQRAAEQLRITVHIADILQRQKFIMVMCKALMLFGAPTHRLEEYMMMTSRVLEIDGQFIYLPGCMIMAFGDAATRTSEVHLIKCSQGVNLSKLNDVHKIYKGVIHDLMGVDEASAKLNKILRLKNNYNPWLCVLFYGLGSSMVCPFAFSGGWTDIPIAFGVGLCVGYLQFFVSSMSNLYSSVFEVSSSIVVSFIARAIGSINNGKTFCFSAIAQGSLALILPGYIILCGSLELQSRNLVAGSVRMFYAIIYSLFLGFGITLGAALYGWVDKNSVSSTSCATEHTIDPKFRIIFVPAFTCCLGLINQANISQLPTMIIIAGAGYVATYFAGKHFEDVSEFTACIGAFIVGILGNLYSRIWKGLAVSAMLPAIFVQVPSGIASQSSLLSGIQAADQIVNSTNRNTQTRSNPLAFGSTMVEVSIGISVGLFAAALVIYPFGKKKTGLFSL